jgi:hypothetical protein
VAKSSAAEVACEDVDPEVEEVDDEEEEASKQDCHDPGAVALTNIEARYEAWKAGVQATCTSAVHAFADALCAAVMAVEVKAYAREMSRSYQPQMRTVDEVTHDDITIKCQHRIGQLLDEATKQRIQSHKHKINYVHDAHPPKHHRRL